MNLLWSHGRPGQSEVFAQGISPQMGRHCELAHIVDPAHSERFGIPHVDAVLGQCWLILDLEAPPNVGSHLLSAGDYRLIVRVAAANALPAIHTIELSLSGRWYDEQDKMFFDGVKASAHQS